MTRLEKLCELHGQQGGTIWQFNWRYGFDFLEMTDREFAVWCMGFEARGKFERERNQFKKLNAGLSQRVAEVMP